MAASLAKGIEKKINSFILLIFSSLLECGAVFMLSQTIPLQSGIWSGKNTKEHVG